MKYEQPEMVIETIKATDVIITSLNDGGTSGEGNGPETDFGW